MLKAFLQRQFGKIFEQRIPTDTARSLFSSDGSIPPLRNRIIDVAFVAIAAPDVSTYSERVAITGEIAAQHEGSATSLVPVFIVIFGSVLPAPQRACARFVSSLRSRLGDSVAIVHGSIEASFGGFGHPGRLEFGFWWPGMHDALRLLGRLSPGEIHELPNETRPP